MSFGIKHTLKSYILLVIYVTLKKRFKNTAIMLMPVVILSMAVLFGGVFAKHGGKAALVLVGTQMPAESVGVFIDELEGGSSEEIQNVIDELNIPEHTAPSKSVLVPSSDSVSKVGNQTPADIQSLIDLATQTQANAVKSGNIRECTYGEANATDVYNGVTVRNVTESHSVDIAKCLKADCVLNTADKSQPLVLIYHTHTTESYEMLDRGWYSDTFPTRSSSESTNMVRVGDAICERLTAAGYSVIHDRQIHDTSYTGSYARSREAIEEYKKKYPSLQVIIDVHRDGIKHSDGTKTKPVATINGKKSAQIMIIAGCEDGKITEFPGWENNLNFAVQLQKHAEDMYPGLMRPIYFSPRKYNMDTSPCGVLLEMGSDANTLDEAVYAGALIGDALASLMNEYD